MAMIYMSLDDINGIISKITNSKDQISTKWNSIKTEDVEKIKESWMGKDCDVYINKIMEMDTQMQNAVASLQLLVDTYTSAKNQILATQQQVTNSVSKL